MKHLLTTLLVAPIFWACSESSPDTAGATSETTNGIAFIVVDADRTPVAHARLTLYSKDDISVQGTAETDSLGKALFDTLVADAFIEGIAGNDSALMSWTTLDTNQTEIQLQPSASLTVRTGAPETDFEKLHEALALESTPYMAARSGSEYVFSHVPAGVFDIVAGDSLVTTVSLEKGTAIDTLVHVQNVTREFVFEDFDDGDSLNNMAKVYPNFGWYYGSIGNAKFVIPDTANHFTSAIEDGLTGKHLSIRYDISDTGYVMLGTHLGLDSGYYDLSRLTAIRMKVSGDSKFFVALEHYKEIENNTYRKALWEAEAGENWSEIVFRPGEETLQDESHQVLFSEIATEIGFFTIFVRSGTYLQIDEIVFEGIDAATIEETP